MITLVKGKLEIKMTGFVVIDVGGLGYKVFMSDNSIEKLGNIGDNVKVYTHHHVREDDISLYGFCTMEELRMFELLIGVSGVGAKTALTMLAVIDPSNFALAIISEDVATLTKIPGIGAKSAQRIILELKDKLKKENIDKNSTIQMIQPISGENKMQEAIEALQVLGYNRKEIEKAFSKLEKTSLTTEELIRKGLNILSN